MSTAEVDEHAPRRTRGDGRATRQRILIAATEEFARHGIAGSRVDRIAAAAEANKAQLYAYFGNKDQLFDTVLNLNVASIVDAAPLDAFDLSAYAVSLYDAYLAHPHMVRLAMWNRLERRPTGPLFHDAAALDEAKIASITEAQRAGRAVPDVGAREVHDLVVAMSMAWSPVSVTVAGSQDESRAVHDERRAALARAVRRAFVSAK